MDKHIYKNCQDPHQSGSDVELEHSNYSSKDGSSNLECLFTETIKSEYVQMNEDFQFNSITDEKPPKAEVMNKTFKLEKSLLSFSNKDSETLSVKKRQTFKCSYCPKVFSNSSAIAKHKLTHSDERKYVCDTCGKAFKRQDHLNGHKHTHKTNKPHACHLCDRSYSDARSLRRHYENQHQNEFMRCKEQKGSRDSGGSSMDEACSAEVFGLLDEHNCIKCDVCNKGFKNQSALNGHMRLHGGYGQTKNYITGPGELKHMASFVTHSTESSDTTEGSVKCLSRMPNTVLITTMPTETTAHSQLKSLLSIGPSKNTISNRLTQCKTSTQDSIRGFDHCLPVISSTVLGTDNLSNINMDELCLCLSPSSSNNINKSTYTLAETPNSSISNNHANFTISSTMNTEVQHTSLPGHYSTLNSSLNDNTRSTGVNDTNMFNYSSIIDGNDLSFSNSHPDEYNYNWDNTHTSYISTTTDNNINKQGSYYDLPDNKSSNLSSLPQISSSNNLQDLIMNLESIDTYGNIDVDWCKFSDGNDDPNIIAESSETESIVKKGLIDNCVINSSTPTPNDELSNNVYKQSNAQESLMPVPLKKNKSRPAPIFIPPQTSAHMSRLRSPRVWNSNDGKEVIIPPYTPPPMLSPQRKGSGLFHSVLHCNNRTSGSFSGTTTSNSSCNSYMVSSSSLRNHQISSTIAQSPFEEKIRSVYRDPFDNHFIVAKRFGEPEHFLYQDDCFEYQGQSEEDSDGLPTSATPRINIGPQYQAQLPPYCHDKRRIKEDKRVWDVLLWDPKQFKDTLENSSSLDLLMKIASSPAVKGCGLNMEYTFHLLCKYKGDFEKTLQALLEASFVVYDYVYAETTNWRTEEINKFQERLKKHDKDFIRVALDLQSCGMNKSVKACVEFYYVWKQMNSSTDTNRYRSKSSRKKFNNTTLNEDSTCANNNDVTAQSGLLAAESGYNLRKNPKLYVTYASYEYRTSSDSSSREPSPIHCKQQKHTVVSGIERVKKPKPYHCSQCKKKYTKPKALENHVRSHKISCLIPENIPR